MFYFYYFFIFLLEQLSSDIVCPAKEYNLHIIFKKLLASLREEDHLFEVENAQLDILSFSGLKVYYFKIIRIWIWRSTNTFYKNMILFDYKRTEFLLKNNNEQFDISIAFDNIQEKDKISLEQN